MLEKINEPKDLKKLSLRELKELAKEIRERIIDVTSKHGGHVAPGLGVVELTLAVHYVFDPPRDKIVWDVSHQAYAHKLITGRRDVFHTLRQWGGISGFLSRKESIYDTFGAGHASTSLSAALGIACARDKNGEDFHVVAIIGDGALTGGMALEALNNIGHLKKNILIILNDNRMSIAENVGGLKEYLVKLQSGKIYNRLKADVWDLLGHLPMGLSKKARETARKILEGLKNLFVPTILFEELGIRYFGPVDGHDLKDLIELLRDLKELPGPKLLHIVTKKGKGYPPAEENPTLFHGLGPYDKDTGKPIKKEGPPTYSKVFGRAMVEIAEKNEKIVAITAAMPEGTGLDVFRERFPERFYDVGIAEQHAVTFAAGLATEGVIPVCAIYSTFLQRAFDQIIHDVALQNLHVVFAIDRGGVVGEDGPTHHGVFDLTYLRLVPGMVIMAPRDENYLRHMLLTAINYHGPIALRYPRDRGLGVEPEEMHEIEIGKGEILREGKDCVIFAVGSMVVPSLEASEILKEKGIDACVVDARFIKPLDRELILSLASEKKKVITVEENTLEGGFGSAVMELLNENKVSCDLSRIGLPDRFIEHGARKILLEVLGLTPHGIAGRVEEFLKGR